MPDIHGARAALARAGVKIPRPPGPMNRGDDVIAFIAEPDGYMIELIERQTSNRRPTRSIGYDPFDSLDEEHRCIEGAFFTNSISTTIEGNGDAKSGKSPKNVKFQDGRTK